MLRHMRAEYDAGRFPATARPRSRARHRSFGQVAAVRPARSRVELGLPATWRGPNRLVADRVSQHRVGDHVEGEPGQSDRLRVVEDEDLGDQQPDEDPAQEPAIRGDVGRRQRQDATDDESRPEQGREQLPEGRRRGTMVRRHCRRDEQHAADDGRRRVEQDDRRQRAREQRVDRNLLVASGKPSRDGLPPGLLVGTPWQLVEVPRDGIDQSRMTPGLVEQILDPASVIPFDRPVEPRFEQVQGIGQTPRARSAVAARPARARRGTRRRRPHRSTTRPVGRSSRCPSS